MQKINKALEFNKLQLNFKYNQKPKTILYPVNIHHINLTEINLYDGT